jgi:hypothetical protein
MRIYFLMCIFVRVGLDFCFPKSLKPLGLPRGGKMARFAHSLVEEGGVLSRGTPAHTFWLKCLWSALLDPVCGSKSWLQ